MVIDAIIAMTKREEKTMQEFLTALSMERDAIISFSLDGIIEGNNKKEEIVKKLEYLKAEKEKLLVDPNDRETVIADETMQTLNRQMAVVMKEIKTAMDKNMKLLSFSIDHVRSSIESIIGSIDTAVGYGKKREEFSSRLLSKVI